MNTDYMDWKNCNYPLLEITPVVIYVVARYIEKKKNKSNQKTKQKQNDIILGFLYVTCT